jgi:hypothetical protein
MLFFEGGEISVAEVAIDLDSPLVLLEKLIEAKFGGVIVFKYKRHG